MDKFEPYHDDQFYKFVHDDLFGDYDWWPDEPFFHAGSVRTFSYKDYLHHWALAEQEHMLFDVQKPRLSEEEFQKLKKRLNDLLTVPDPPDRTLRQQRDLMGRLSLNPYQQYHYQDYIRHYRAAEETGHLPKSEEQLAEEVFLRTKRELLESLQHKPLTESRLASEKRLRAKLFPGSYVS
ncbi:MAG: hypothetical protein HY598_01355 [Candidatus Omnitrophica bacterium]|nr:hypothetical protein [Candidatus Omnitrophota bacterium]